MAKRAIIRLGDPTSHGGTVQEGFSTFNVYGKKASGIGHRGYCPLCKQEFVIVAGAESFNYLGKSVAVEGMPTSCGAVLIATQSQATVDSTSESSITPSGPLTPLAQRAPTTSRHSHDLHFVICGEQTGKPLAHVPYRLVLEDGTEIIGKSNALGLTEKISAAYPALVTLTAPYYDKHQTQHTDETDAGCGCDSCLSENS